MSADLFAAFGTESSVEQQKSQSASTSPANPATSNVTTFHDLNFSPAHSTQHQSFIQPQAFTHPDPFSATVPASDDNDDWGDFEGTSTVEATVPHVPQPFTSPPQSNLQLTPASWNISSNQNDSSFNTTSPAPQTNFSGWQSAPIVKAKKSSDPTVLFDAEDDAEDEDDFGDFEGSNDNGSAAHVPVPARAPVNQSALVDLMGDMSMSPPKPATKEERSKGLTLPSSHSREAIPPKKSPIGGFGNIKQPKPKPAPKETLTKQEDDTWDTFDDWEASIPAKAPEKVTTKPEVSRHTATTADQTFTAPTQPTVSDDPLPGELPPTNVPPPGILLSLFPSLFNEAQEKLFKPMAAQALPMRNKLMAEPATIAFLQAYLALANVAARVIAGRKLRWKRDQHLSQGMRIGPASSRATSGMKLTGVDKGENMKEEREVADVVRVWKDQVGRLRHVVSGVNQIKAGTLGAVPDLNEALPVKTLKQSEGGIPARQPCMLCGLKRDERVTATDIATDDSFGEWWVDQVNMHRGCRNFWHQHKDTLRQR